MSADMERVRRRDKWLHEGMKLDWPDFDDWLARVKREVAAEALTEAADEARRIETGTPWIESGAEIVHCDIVREDPAAWLRARAAEIREGN